MVPLDRAAKKRRRRARKRFRDDVFIQKLHAQPIGGKYLLMGKLGKGGFGAVYLGKDKETGTEVAIKLEPLVDEAWLLRSETGYYEEELQNLDGFPRMYAAGHHIDFRYLVLDALGPSLDKLLRMCGHRFSLKTTLMLADQMLLRLQDLCSREIIHRDVKPDNFLLGTGRDGNHLYMIDFGFAQTGQSLAARPDAGPRLIGTARYASLEGHRGGGLRFKDDLESLGYILVHFLSGQLPWQDIDYDGNPDKSAVMNMKRDTSRAQLCAGLPSEFKEYMELVADMDARKPPDYAKLRQLFRDLATRERIEYDNIYDWTILFYLQDQQKGAIDKAKVKR